MINIQVGHWGRLARALGNTCSCFSDMLRYWRGILSQSVEVSNSIGVLNKLNGFQPELPTIFGSYFNQFYMSNYTGVHG